MDAIYRQNVLWLAAMQHPTVVDVDERRREFKRAFASSLLGLRAGRGSQAVLAKVAATSEATYRRWENPEEEHLPDAFELRQLLEHFGADPSELLTPAELSPRERELLRRLARGARRGGDPGPEDDSAPEPEPQQRPP